MTDRELIYRLLSLAQTAVDQALNLDYDDPVYDDPVYDDPEDYFIYRELQELKAAVATQPATIARCGTPNLAQVRSSLGDGPSNIELLQLMPESMMDEFSYAAKACSVLAGGRVKPSIFRVTLNTAALEYARAVLARWGRP
jgi:hypothetical protein